MRLCWLRTSKWGVLWGACPKVPLCAIAIKATCSSTSPPAWYDILFIWKQYPAKMLNRSVAHQSVFLEDQEADGSTSLGLYWELILFRVLMCPWKWHGWWLSAFCADIFSEEFPCCFFETWKIIPYWHVPSILHPLEAVPLKPSELSSQSFGVIDIPFLDLYPSPHLSPSS